MATCPASGLDGQLQIAADKGSEAFGCGGNLCAGPAGSLANGSISTDTVRPLRSRFHTPAM